VGGLSSLASSKSKKGVDAQAYIVKALAWWLSLCGKLGVRSVEEMLWDKFPGVCTYCQKKPHDSDICLERKAASGGPPWEVLAVMGEKAERPKRLRDWQSMFAQIYPVQQTEDYGPSFARLAEELGELAEAVRIFSSEPGYLLSEAADVFAWIMHIQNILHSKSGTNAARRGEALEQTFARSYPNGCVACSKKLCACPPILASTIGRIAHEVPRGRGSYGDAGRFMTPERELADFFRTDFRHAEMHCREIVLLTGVRAGYRYAWSGNADVDNNGDRVTEGGMFRRGVVTAREF
jgi:NTP pyrophosphatase (non-canonical NTP hydrolase)